MGMISTHSIHVCIKCSILQSTSTYPAAVFDGVTFSTGFYKVIKPKESV